jgi:hypothetical protein
MVLVVNQTRELTCADVALYCVVVGYTNLHQQQAILGQLQKTDIGH